MRRLLPATLTGRLVLTAVGLIAVVGILVALTTSLLMRQSLTKQLDNRLEDSAQRAQHVNEENRVQPGGDDPDHDGLPPMYGPVADVGTLTAVLSDRLDEGGVVTRALGGGERRAALQRPDRPAGRLPDLLVEPVGQVGAQHRSRREREQQAGQRDQGDRGRHQAAGQRRGQQPGHGLRPRA